MCESCFLEGGAPVKREAAAAQQVQQLRADAGQNCAGHLCMKGCMSEALQEASPPGQSWRWRWVAATMF
jgi:hypothetical protein